jgi:hypothetical protein
MRRKRVRTLRAEKRTHAAGIFLSENPNDGLRKARPLRNIAHTPIPRPQ